jgi:hypothetical protein
MSPDFPRVVGFACYFHFAVIIFFIFGGLLFGPENGEYAFLRNIGSLVPSYTEFHIPLTSNSPVLFP